MRIAVLADPLDRQYGGIHIYTKEILNALSKLDKKNEYLVFRSKTMKEFDGMEEIVVPYSSFPGYRFWRIFFQIPKLLKKKNIDLVVEPAHFGPLNLPKKIKRITVIHDMTVFMFPKYHVFLSQFLQRKFLPRILKKTDCIITNSESTSKDLIHHFPFTQNKTSTVLLGKDDSFIPQSDHSILTKYKINQPYILFVGTLEPRKNITTLIEAFNLFKTQTKSPHQLLLLGKKGWKSKNVFAAIEESPFKEDIIWHGYVPKKELPVFYTMAEIFVYPSNYEGFGLPVLEAMACGTPVITSNVSSLPEVGESAVVYTNPNSPNEISQWITTLCSNPEMQDKFSKLGLIQANKFSWEKTATAYIKLFETLT
ncbi:MAG: glycosyltransferase family 1 protein [Saprospiraceae bacterium]|nr:glycosyltransferase family 1 protein [Saprospiraceae bacterium]